MTRRPAKRASRGARPLQFLRNLTAGDGGPFERLRKVAANLSGRGSDGCCGNYGEPGC